MYIIITYAFCGSISQASLHFAHSWSIHEEYTYIHTQRLHEHSHCTAFPFSSQPPQSPVSFPPHPQPNSPIIPLHIPHISPCVSCVRVPWTATVSPLGQDVSVCPSWQHPRSDPNQKDPPLHPLWTAQGHLSSWCGLCLQTPCQGQICTAHHKQWSHFNHHNIISINCAHQSDLK